MTTAYGVDREALAVTAASAVLDRYIHMLNNQPDPNQQTLF